MRDGGSVRVARHGNEMHCFRRTICHCHTGVTLFNNTLREAAMHGLWQGIGYHKHDR